MSNQARFVHVNTRSVFDDKKASGEITNSDLVFIKETAQIAENECIKSYIKWTTIWQEEAITTKDDLMFHAKDSLFITK